MSNFLRTGTVTENNGIELAEYKLAATLVNRGMKNLVLYYDSTRYYVW